jgi:hypothetical protein
MRTRSQRGLAANAALVAALALAGVFLAHTAAHLRAYGLAGLRFELDNSIHRYVMPRLLVVALVAVLLACLWAGVRLLTLVRHAQRLGDDLALRASRRPLDVLPRWQRSRWSAVRLLAVLLPLQVSLYVLQENLETWWDTGWWPQLAVVTGPVHGDAIPIHAAVAVLLCLAVAAVHRLLARVERVVHQRALLLVLLYARPAAEGEPHPVTLFIPRLQQFLGAVLWQRPPPVAVASSV